MTPIVRDGKTLANVDVGAAFGKEFVERAKKRFGIDLAVYSFDGKDFKKLSSTFGDGCRDIRRVKGVLTPAIAPRRHDRRPAAALYLGQIKNYAGQPVGILEIIKDTTDVRCRRRVRTSRSVSDDRDPDRRTMLAFCSVARLRHWLDHAHGDRNPCFRRARSKSLSPSCDRCEADVERRRRGRQVERTTDMQIAWPSSIARREGYARAQRLAKDEAERRAWATVNKETGGGNKSGSGRGVKDTNVSAKRGGRIGGPRGGKAAGKPCRRGAIALGEEGGRDAQSERRRRGRAHASPTRSGARKRRHGRARARRRAKR